MLKMFTVYDSKAESYLRPFSMLSTGEAIRGFITTLNDGQSELCKYPADFTLFELGTFDPLNCEINLYDAKKNLVNGLEHKWKADMNSSPILKTTESTENSKEE